jgi:hypothetical protein
MYSSHLGCHDPEDLGHLLNDEPEREPRSERYSMENKTCTSWLTVSSPPCTGTSERADFMLN